jgi:alpha-D-ribose 1-methylphosphonate 5-triphosphate synthase subunit PhnG
MDDQPTDPAARKRWLSLLAQAPESRLMPLLESAIPRPAFDWLRRPEVGTVMVQGRAGATGAPFNLGEMTVTRCALRLGCGTVGHGYVQGRSKPAAEAAALVDALMQTAAAPVLTTGVLEPLAAQQAARRRDRAEKAAATRVEFFTMVRGES